jgi:hypothetical protein
MTERQKRLSQRPRLLERDEGLLPKPMKIETMFEHFGSEILGELPFPTHLAQFLRSME